MHINIESGCRPRVTTRLHAFGGTGFFSDATSSLSLWNPPKKHAMHPPHARDSTEPNTKCDSTPIPLSARHGRLTSRRRIWHASRTRRSVSNIIGSVPNGKRRWGGVRYRFIPLDHPPVHGPDAHRSVPPANPKPAHQRTPHRAGCPSASMPKKTCDAPPKRRARPFSHSQTQWKFTCSWFWPSTRRARTMGSGYIVPRRRRNRRRRRRSRPARTFPSAGTRCTK